MSKSRRSIFCLWCGAAGSRRYGKDRSGRQCFHCPHCGRTFRRRTRTARAGSRLTDEQWQRALDFFCTRAGCSGADMARVLGINVKTARRMNRVFRKLVLPLAPTILPGASEWDEAILGKQWVLGGVSRHTRQCLLRCIPNRREDTLAPLVMRWSDAEGIVLTDELLGYISVPNRWSVCHAREFVNSAARFVHTNTVEGVWSHMKSLSRHVYRGFPVETLSEFLGEFMFRYNLRSYDTRKSVLSALLSRKSIHAHLV